MFDRLEYWRDPEASTVKPNWHVHCKPEFYLDLTDVTRLVVETIGKYCEPEYSILEIGCGTGRNLVGLYEAGFHNLAGVEISQKSVNLGREHFPQYNKIPVQVEPIEEAIIGLAEFDVIYTQSCLMHLSHDVNWVLDEIKEKAQKVLISIEGENIIPEIHRFKRNYQDYYEGDKWQQVESKSCEQYRPFPDSTIMRVFLRGEQ